MKAFFSPSETTPTKEQGMVSKGNTFASDSSVAPGRHTVTLRSSDRDIWAQCLPSSLPLAGAGWTWLIKGWSLRHFLQGSKDAMGGLSTSFAMASLQQGGKCYNTHYSLVSGLKLVSFPQGGKPEIGGSHRIVRNHCKSQEISGKSYNAFIWMMKI